MKNKNFRLMKVFYTSQMPGDIKAAFRSSGVMNIWTIKQNIYKYTLPNGTEVNDEDKPYAINEKKVDQWLIENGANDASNSDSEGETVVILEW